MKNMSLPSSPPQYPSNPWDPPASVLAARVSPPVSLHPPRQDRRALENIFLNLGLYLGSLLIISASSLLVSSLATGPMQGVLLCALTLFIYAAGLVSYRWIPKLRLASYSFTATGLALIPVCGLAIYYLMWPLSGALLWLLVSLVGTAAVLGALALMKARVMIYLAVAFVVSDVLAVSKTMQVGLIWYFVSLLLLATALALIQRFAPAQLPVQLTRGINDSARVFVPVTMFASMMIGTRLQFWETALIFVLGTLYAVTFVALDRSFYFYVQARLYSLLATLYFTLWLCEFLNNYVYVLLPTAILSLISCFILGLVNLPALPWAPSKDLMATWCLAQPPVIFSVAAVMVDAHAEPTLFGSSSGGLGATLVLSLLVTLNAAALGLVGRSHLKTYIPALAFIVGILGFLALPTIPLVVLLLGLAALHVMPKPLSHGAQLPGVAGGLALPALLLLLLQITDSHSYWALLFLGLSGAVCYLYSELATPRTAETPSNARIFSAITLLASGVITPVLLSIGVDVAYRYRVIPGSLEYSALSVGIASYLGLIVAGALLTLDRTYRALDARPIHQNAPVSGQIYTLSPLQTPYLLLTALYVSIGLILISAPAVLMSHRDYLMYAALLLGTLAIFWKASPRTFSHLGILIRLYLLWAAIQLTITSSLFSLHTALIITFLAFLLSACSLLLIRFHQLSRSANTELITGLVFGWVALLAALPLIRTDIKVTALLGALLLTGLALLWQVASRRPAVSALQVALASGALTLLGYPLLAGNLRFSDALSLLLLGMLSLAGSKTWAALSASTQPAHISNPKQEDYLGRWGYEYNATTARTGLALTHLYLLHPVWAEPLALSCLAILILTVGWWVQVAPQMRLYPPLVGINLLMFRILVENEMREAFLYFSQALVFSFSLLLVFSIIRRQKPSLILYSIALGIQAFGTLYLTVAGWSLPWSDRLIIVLVTLVLLVATVLLKRKILVILVVAILSYQILYIVGGLNIFSLFILGFALIGLVIWRLLARDETIQTQPHLPRRPCDSQPTAPPATGSNPSGTQQTSIPAWQKPDHTP